MDVKLRNAGILVVLAAACLAGSCGGESRSSPIRPSTGGTVESVSITMFPPSGSALTTGYTKHLITTARLHPAST